MTDFIDFCFLHVMHDAHFITSLLDRFSICSQALNYMSPRFKLKTSRKNSRPGW